MDYELLNGVLPAQIKDIFLSSYHIYYKTCDKITKNIYIGT